MNKNQNLTKLKEWRIYNDASSRCTSGLLRTDWRLIQTRRMLSASAQYGSIEPRPHHCDTFDAQSTPNVRMRSLARLSTLAWTTATLFWSAHLNKTFSPYNEFRMRLPGSWSAQECRIISRRISRLCTGFPSSIVSLSNCPQFRTKQSIS